MLKVKFEIIVLHKKPFDTKKLTFLDGVRVLSTSNNNTRDLFLAIELVA